MDSSHGGRQSRFPPIATDPEAWADLALRLGYDTENVVRSLQSYCKLDEQRARDIVVATNAKLGGST